MWKPENLCDELGCTREWEIVVTTFGQPTLSPKSSTAMNTKLCAVCAEKREKNATTVTVGI